MKRTLPADIHGVGVGVAGGVRMAGVSFKGDQEPLSSGVVGSVMNKGKRKICWNESEFT